MSTLHNSISIDAPPEMVWQTLANLEALEEYDPGVVRSRLTSSAGTGLGAARRCELEPKGWFEERVTEWQPGEALTFELSACNLPVAFLRHRYTLVPDGSGTRVTQHMEYRLKYGLLGRALDALVVRRQWDAGIKGFLAGLKARVESGQGSGAGRASVGRLA
jgi:ligand-binding SRPBCC domain-containing protein